MTSLLLFMLACDSPVPLPPKTGVPAVHNARMVQMPDFRGYLQRSEQKGRAEGILLIVDQIDEMAHTQAKKHSNNEVLIIDTQTASKAAKAYLLGLEGVTTVRVICSLPGCDKTSRASSNPVGTGG